MYLTSFEMFHKNTFLLIIASEKGKGKSVRAIRMATILPEGWCTKNSGSTDKSHANGNNSPANGTVVVCDEMIADLTPAVCTPKMEAIKTIVGEREIEIERTRSVKTADGTDQHVTFKIVTDHKQVYVVCCNMGQCFTIGMDEPSPGKDALIQRTVCLQARAESNVDSPHDTFMQTLHYPDVAKRVSDFRLFTALVGFVLLTIKDLPWLQPDFAVANLIFKEGDRMLSKEYGLPAPEPRRLVKRLSNLTTMCVQEATARVLMFKQTGAAYEAGRPNDDGTAKPFDVGDLWDVVRTLRPTREMILAAWSHSLEYSIGTSSHGVNVMDAICERLGFVIDNVFRKMYTKSAAQMMPTAEGEGGEMPSYMRGVSYETAGGSNVAIGADPTELADLHERLTESRKTRCEFRHAAIGSADRGSDPLSSIRALAGDEKRGLRYSGALFPSVRTVGCYYKSKAVLRWAAGYSIGRREAIGASADAPIGGGTGLPFKLRNAKRHAAAAADGDGGDGGSKEHDFGWFVLSTTPNKEGTGASWRAGAAVVGESKMCSMFDMHSEGVSDALYMLASNENKRPCPEMPAKLPFHMTQSQAFIDEKGNAFGKTSQEIRIAPVSRNGGAVEAHKGDPVEARDADDPDHRSKVPVHEQIDVLHNRGRFPALMPHTSTRVENSAPIRWQNGSGIEVNATVVYEHTMCKMEGILRCAKVPGLRGLQENFISGGRAPACLKADARPAGVPVALTEKAERVLPYSVDVQQMAWTIELAERFYNTGKKQAVLNFNRRLRAEGLSAPLKYEELPELSLRYPGFPRAGDAGQCSLRLVSVAVGDSAPADEEKKVEISKADPLQTIDAELLRYQTEVAIGRKASLRDIEDHRRSLIGSGYVWGVTGDVFDYDTWQDHLCASMIGRGNVDPEQDAQRGGFVDKAFEAVLDSELMLDVRLVERRAVKGELPETKYDIDLPAGSTHRHLEALARRDEARVTGTKRHASAPALLSGSSGKRTGADVMRERNRQWGAQLTSPSLANRSPSLAVSRSRHGGAGPSRRQDSHDDEE